MTQYFNQMTIEDTFLHLTRTTCPAGYEQRVYGAFLEKRGWQRDQDGNYFLKMGEPDTAFTAHLDDVSHSVQTIHHTFGQVVGTDGSSVLGADCKAGVALLVHMAARGIEGLYVLFHSEEIGRIGSEQAAERMRQGDQMFAGITKMVSFDRRGYDSVITHQMGRRTCSHEFAQALAEAIGHHMPHNYPPLAPDDGGSYTDSYSFQDLIPECTNVSVGYQNAHSHRETQDLWFLSALLESLCLVDWKSMPVRRTVTRLAPSEDFYDFYPCEEFEDGFLSFSDVELLHRYYPEAFMSLLDVLEEGTPLHDYALSLVCPKHRSW